MLLCLTDEHMLEFVFPLPQSRDVHHDRRERWSLEATRQPQTSSPFPDSEGPMKTQSIQAVDQQPINEPVGNPSECSHSRLVDDVLTPGGQKTAEIRCIECNAIVPDLAPEVK